MNFIHQVNSMVLLDFRLNLNGAPLTGKSTTVKIIDPNNPTYYYDWSSDTFVTTGGIDKQPLTEVEAGLYRVTFDHSKVPTYGELKMTFEVTGTYAGFSDEFHTFLNLNEIVVRRTVAYDYSAQTLKVVAWLERNNTVVSSPTSSILTVYTDAGAELFTPLPNTSPETNHTFVFTKTGVTLIAAKSYLAKVSIISATVTYETMTSFVTVGKQS